MSQDINFGIRIRLDEGGMFQAEVSQAEASVRKLTSEAKKGADDASKSFMGLQGTIGSLAKIAGIGFSVATLYEAAGAAIKLADEYSTLQSRIKLVTASAQQQAEVYGKLLGIANGARVGVSDLAGTYAQLARSTADLGIGQDRLLGITKTISQAMTIGGGSADSMRGALVQLSQGFASGTLRGEELNSILEQTPRLAQAIADGMGVSVGRLRAMGAEGELTAEAIAAALEKSAGAVDKEFGQVETTVGQALAVLGNSTLDLVGKFDKASGASRTLATMIKELGSVVTQVGSIFDSVTTGDNWFANFNRRFDANVERMAKAQHEDNINREMATASPSRRVELRGELAALQGKEFAADDARQAASMLARIKAQDQATSSVKAYINAVDNMSKSEKKTREMAKAWDEFAKATKGVAEGTREYTDAQAALAQREKNIADKFKEKTAGAGAEKKAARDRLKDIEDQRRAMNEALGVTGDYVESLGRYERLLADGSISQETFTKAILELIEKQPMARDLAKDHADEQKRLNDEARTWAKIAAEGFARDVEAWNTDRANLTARVKAVGESVEAARRQNEEIGLSAVALADLRAKYDDLDIAEKQRALNAAIERGDDEDRITLLSVEILKLKELREEKLKGANKGARLDSDSRVKQALDDSMAESRRAFDQMGQSLADSLMKGGKSGADLFRSLTLRPALNVVGATISQGAQGAIGSAFPSMLGAFGRGSGFAGVGTSIATSSIGTALGLSEAIGPGVAMTSAGSMFAGALSAVPYIGAAVALYSMLAKQRGGPKSGGSFSTTGARLFTPNGADADLAGLGLGNSFSAMASRFGGTAGGVDFGIGYDTDPRGTANNRVASFARAADGRMLLDNRAGRDVGRDDATLKAEIATETKRVLLAAMQAAEVTDGFAEVFARLDPAVAAPDAIDGLFALAEQLRGLGEAAKDLPGVMGSVATLSAVARESLITLAGGLDALNAAQGTYYSEFFTQSEQQANLARVLTGRLGAVGVEFGSLGASSEAMRAGFKALVEGQDLATDAGTKQYAALLALASPMDQYLDVLKEQEDAAADAAGATSDLVVAIEDQTSAIQSQIDAIDAAFGDLEAAMAELDPAASSLVDAWRANRSELETLREALDGVGVSASAAAIARMNSADASLSSVRGARAGLQDRIVDAQLRGMAPGDQVNALRSMEQALWSQVGTGGDQSGVIGEIEKLVLRRLGVEGDIAAGAASALSTAAKQARDDQTAALEAQRDAAREQLDALKRMRDFARDIAGFAVDLRVGDLSALSPADRIAAARDAFRANVAGAAANDPNAQAGLRGSATAYLNLQKQFSGSNGDFAAVFAEVTAAVDELAASVGAPDAQLAALQAQADAAQKQIEAIKESSTEQVAAAVASSAREVETLQALDAALARNESALVAEAAASRAEIAAMAAELTRQTTIQEADIREQVAHRRTLEAALAAVATSTAATADNTSTLALTVAAPAVVAA